MPEALAIAGAIWLGYGLWSWWPPAAHIVGGLVLMIIGIRLAIRELWKRVTTTPPQ